MTAPLGLLATERALVAEGGRRLLEDRLVVGSAGNLSVRAGERVAISPSGVDYRAVSPDDVCVIDLAGRHLAGLPTPSSETPMHLALYRATPAGAVVHTHSPFVTALSTVLEDALPPIHYTAVDLGGSVPLVPYATFGSEELAGSLAAAAAGHQAAVLQCHGGLTWGATLAQAHQRAQLLEWLAEVYWRARALGAPRLLSPAQLDEVRAQVARVHGQRPPGSGRRDEGREGAVSPGSIPETVAWTGDAVRLVDQRRLPEALTFVEVATVEELCRAIAGMVVRGAPALGVAGAMGVALAARTGGDVEAAAGQLVATRPTAVNLRWGVERALAAADPLAEACRLAEEDVSRNRRLGTAGAVLVPPGSRVMTHCHAGALACAGYGTALGIIRAAHEAGRQPTVWVRETRPLLQGSRITAWELQRLGVPATVVVDGAAASLMAAGEVDCVVVGADRVAANGDVANKIGTYDLAVLAAHHGIPFLVAAPTSTVDLACPDGSAIPVEQRADDEVGVVGTRRVVPSGVGVRNPAFDVTPAGLVTAIVTEEGVARAPFGEVLAEMVARGAAGSVGVAASGGRARSE